MTEDKESPEYIKISTASAMALGIKNGRFYRGAANPCINLLLTYKEGCFANCAYCGLARQRPGYYEEKSFIHVAWPTEPTAGIIDIMREKERKLKRVCISMVTNPRATRDTLVIARQIHDQVDLPLSLLISPTIVKNGDLEQFKDTGADMIGVAIDTATEELFDTYRGKDVHGPHRWDNYWGVLRDAVDVFGPGKVSSHLIVGLGESELAMVKTFQKIHDLGALIHLFSFFAEKESTLENVSQPSWDKYLRLQLARYVIEQEMSHCDRFDYSEDGTINQFGLSPAKLLEIVNSGIPFVTSGCPGKDGTVACNRPFGNCLPGPQQWNYPYLPDRNELALIREGLGLS